MLHTQTVEAGTIVLTRRFMADPMFSQFSLAGGTALALKMDTANPSTSICLPKIISLRSISVNTFAMRQYTSAHASRKPFTNDEMEKVLTGDRNIFDGSGEQMIRVTTPY